MPSLFQSVLGFVPSFIARGIAGDYALISPPTAQPFAASIMFVDIVGFTPLSERLALRGPLGAEELSALIKVTFSPIIDLVEEHGGDVIRFAGDAVIAMWPARRPAGLDETTLRAAQCALAIQAALHPEQPSETHPALRIVISAGDALAMAIGGRSSHWQWIVAGRPLSQISAVQPAAQPGAVTLPGETWSLVAASCAGADAGAGAVRLLRVDQPIAPRPTVRPELTPSGQATLLNFVPTPILDRLIAAETMWLAELRRASVLFLFLPDLNYTDPDALGRVQQVWTIVQAVLNRYGGYMLQFIVDDKGTIILLAYGVPPYIHEDNARRAVQTALEINEQLTRLALMSAIGVTTGQVFCGDSGNQRHWEYSVIGFVVNLAARLMQAAGNEGGILCDHATYLESRTHIDFAAMPSIEVKGSSQPVRVYRPLDGVPVLATPLTPLFGRAEERAWLAESLAAAADGHGRIAILEGEAGIGKSRLLAQLAADAIPAGVLVILGAGDNLEQRTPFW
ncbi:MAG TPA: adenylate/guanylate cyclase domain-containing protein, partial [Herpetosiphonaceae bacterium]|nr:adenylate/guanylate cyclase domain-containing protein [Herpetosiphonaceae bacterium]